MLPPSPQDGGGHFLLCVARISPRARSRRSHRRVGRSPPIVIEMLGSSSGEMPTGAIAICLSFWGDCRGQP